MRTDDFYQSIVPFTEFSDLGGDEHYRAIPDDWVVFVTDVVNSTKAIQAGKYRDINTIGAASISVVLQALGHDVPYVFGGDGATVVVSPTESDAVASALCGLARLAQDQFKQSLRVGRITVEEIRQAGATVEIGRHALESGRCVAVFRGGGLRLADELIKRDADRLQIPAATRPPKDLGGLSCRWRAVPSSKGVVLTLIVVSRPRGSMAECVGFLDFLQQTLECQVTQANPIDVSQMRYHSVWSCLKHERRFCSSRFSIAKASRYCEIIIAVLLFGTRLHRWIPSMKAYASSQRVHTDHRKFDDMLRLVVDCTLDQAEQIRGWLSQAYADERCYYGIHESQSALMTCYVEGLTQGQHIHFVDGNDGGYAMAAIGLKQQINASLSRFQHPPPRPAP